MTDSQQSNLGGSQPKWGSRHLRSPPHYVLVTPPSSALNSVLGKLRVFSSFESSSVGCSLTLRSRTGLRGHLSSPSGVVDFGRPPGCEGGARGLTLHLPGSPLSRSGAGRDTWTGRCGPSTSRDTRSGCLKKARGTDAGRKPSNVGFFGFFFCGRVL